MSIILLHYNISVVIIIVTMNEYLFDAPVAVLCSSHGLPYLIILQMVL